MLPVHFLKHNAVPKNRLQHFELPKKAKFSWVTYSNPISEGTRNSIAFSIQPMQASRPQDTLRISRSYQKQQMLQFHRRIMSINEQEKPHILRSRKTELELSRSFFGSVVSNKIHFMVNRNWSHGRTSVEMVFYELISILHLYTQISVETKRQNYYLAGKRRDKLHGCIMGVCWKDITGKGAINLQDTYSVLITKTTNWRMKKN